MILQVDSQIFFGWTNQEQLSANSTLHFVLE
jgi:hypothetical protein